VCLELRHVLEMVQLETRELEGVKLQHNQKLDQLEKSQDTLLEVSPKKKMSSLPVLFVLLFDMSFLCSGACGTAACAARAAGAAWGTAHPPTEEPRPATANRQREEQPAGTVQKPGGQTHTCSEVTS